MSIQEAVKQILVKRGMAEKMADEVIFHMKADPANACMQRRWGDDVKGYSEELLSLLVILPQKHPAGIDEKNARVWLRPLFVPGEAQAGS